MQVVLSNRLGGNVAREVQPCQALSNPVNVFVSSDASPTAESKLSAGKLVRLEQLSQVRQKFMPAAVLIEGKTVKLLQPAQVA